jgi:hypothetical protein
VVSHICKKTLKLQSPRTKYVPPLPFNIKWVQINAKEYRRGNQKGRIGNIVYTRRRKTKQKQNTICVRHQYTETNTNNANKTRTLLQTTRCKDEPNIIYMRKSVRTPQHGTQNVKTHNMKTQNKLQD